MNNSASIRLDTIDKKILEILQDNCDLPVKDIADMVSLSQTPVHKRIKRLEDAGIIKNYVALVDPGLIGKGLIIFVNISMKEHNHAGREELISKMSSFYQVSELHHTTGAFDFMAKVRVKDIEEYREFLVNDITTINCISDIDSYIVLDSPKDNTKLEFL